jgi:rare lipoprotein A
MPSNIRNRLLVAAALMLTSGGAAYAQSAVTSIPPEDMPAGSGPRGTSGAAQFDDAGRATIDPAVQGIAVAVNGLASGYVEVTSLDNGKTVLALVARGGATPGRLATLAPSVATMLGITGDGALVRVRSVEPPPQDRGALRSGQPASARLDTPLALLAPLRHRVEAQSPYTAPMPRRSAPTAIRRQAIPPSSYAGANYAAPDDGYGAPQPAPPPVRAPARAPVNLPTASGYFVQVAALSSEEKARDLAHSLGGQVQPVGTVWRVRLGPYRDADSAQRARDGVAQRGYAGAQIVHQ